MLPYMDGGEPADTDANLDGLVVKSDALPRQGSRSPFFAVLDAEYEDWWPIGLLLPGESRPAFHYREGQDVNRNSRQAHRYYRARQQAKSGVVHPWH
jgi:hypothetical protein